jgi:hypothetical protein
MQWNIFRDVEPLALSVVDSFSACIFAYFGISSFIPHRCFQWNVEMIDTKA